MWGSAIGCIVTLILNLLVAPLAAEAQPGGKMPIGANLREMPLKIGDLSGQLS